MTNDKLAPKKEPIKITGKPNASALHSRLAEAVAQDEILAQADPLVVPNRIAIMPDASGSMSGYKNQCLHEALTSFINMCDFANTSIAFYSFGQRPEIRFDLSRNKKMLLLTARGVQASGGTPMAEAMADVLGTISLTRAIIISDGCADSPTECTDIAQGYADNETPIDCIHIGKSSHGEDLLKEIARLTGGIYIKFTDVTSFSKAFSYLTPAKRGELNSAIAGLLGAAEIKL